jgi:hypothetical protein
MSLAPDDAPRDPAAYRRPRLMGPGFWAMIALSATCVVAGAALATLGPKLLAKRPQAPAAVVTAAPGPVEPAPVGAAVQVSPSPLPAAAGPAAPQSADIVRLTERLAAMETRQANVAQAAAAALAASALVEASQGSRPFADELAALEALAPSPDLRSLRRLADTGAPSRAALAQAFPDAAARAAGASRIPAEGAGLVERIAYALSRIVTLRQVSRLDGKGADAVLARAEKLIEDGRLDAAMRELDALPESGRAAIAGWRERAERRAEIDRRVAAIRAQALDAMARVARGAPA